MTTVPTTQKVMLKFYLIVSIVVQSSFEELVPTIPKPTFSCDHQPASREEVVLDVNLDPEPHHVVRKRSPDQPLRIHLHYDNSISFLPASHRSLIETLVREAVDYWERTLSVRRTVGPIRLNRQCQSDEVRYRDVDRGRYCVNGCAALTKCGDIFIPLEHLERCYLWDSQHNIWRSTSDAGPGVNNTDFILYVAALSTPRCRKARTIAYAAHCQQEAALDRPVAGYFSICPESISIEKQDHLQLLSTLKHEILHALGFTAGLYAFYYDRNGIPLTSRNSISGKPWYNPQLSLYQWSDKVVKTFQRQNWKNRSGYTSKSVNMIVTPRVVEEVRRHFNCSTLEGAELEDQGIVGTALTHWEKRIFENEAMTGTYTQNPVISRVTLALMEDTGWYSVDYDNAEELEWGKNLGCDFVKRSCLDWIELNRAKRGDIHPFCDEVRRGVLKTDCTRNRDSVAFCNLVEYNSSLPQQYQYFNTLHGIPDNAVGFYGGSVSLADYCPYLQEFAWRSGEVTVRDSRCSLVENNPDPTISFFGETYGSYSKCFNHDRLWKLQQCSSLLSLPHWGSGCYQYHCSPQEGLVLDIGGQSHRCVKEGQRVLVTYTSNHYLHTGSVICPSCTEMCRKSGITCPPEQQPYNVIRSNSQLAVPCSAKAPFHSPSTGIIATSIIANFLCFILISFCRR